MFSASIGLLVLFALNVAALAGPLPLTNTQSGISLTLSGSNGVDWAVERLYHDASRGSPRGSLMTAPAIASPGRPAWRTPGCIC